MTFYVYLLHNPSGNMWKFIKEALSEAKISRSELYIRMLLLRAQVDLNVADENW